MDKEILNAPSEYKSIGFDKPKLILLCGVACSGKSSIGKELHRHFNNCLYLDKDTVTRRFTEKLLVALGSHKDDRESFIYIEKVLETEYQTLIEVAKDNLIQYNNVILNAPFVRQIGDKKWMKSLREYCSELEIELLVFWVQASSNTCYNRILKRSASRDKWKIENWKQYVDSTPHSVPNTKFKEVHLISNDNDYDSIEDIAEKVYKEILFR
jgi:predicted kinase